MRIASHRRDFLHTDDLRATFDRDDPLFNFAIYNPERFKYGPQETGIMNREKQVISLIRTHVIKRFAPYYNCESDEELETYLDDPILILVSTDVLSEGLNLQDANLIVNYDLHWNPVRLMQRIGRVDRRINPDLPIHHDKVYVYNFLPPDELNDLLHLLERLTGKIMIINKTLGIEAPLLMCWMEVC
ncbi:MAG: C-terminal helicase domain-containing protein [Candidatus Bipolaricaulia bacterium]